MGGVICDVGFSELVGTKAKLCLCSGPTTDELGGAFLFLDNGPHHTAGVGGDAVGDTSCDVVRIVGPNSTTTRHVGCSYTDPMFAFYSHRVGILGSIALSVVGSLIVLAALWAFNAP